ncbi:MAG: HD domain-containing protein [Alphaproteobacteria bacterium]|nr:HD domain-containing protein [Alphaproteobacteria bacterium]
MPITTAQAKDMISAVRDRWVSLGRAPDTLYLYDNHVNGVAFVAKTIAAKIGGIDPDAAYVSGLLHDIAKIDESPESHMGRFHGILGYEKLRNIDSDAARAALLHEIPWNKVEAVEYKFMGNHEDYEFVKNYIAENPLRDQDLLIQLADTMANKDGIVTLERRRAEYEARNNTKIPSELIEPYIEIKHYFDKKIGGDVYDLFPDIGK